MKLRNLFIPILTGAIAITPVIAITSCGVIALKDFTVHATEIKIKPNAKTQMFILANPTDATNRDATWSVDDDSLATIDENGELTAKAEEGTVKVTATYKADQTKVASKDIEISSSAATAEDLSNYIYNRTFSIIAYTDAANYYYVMGTGWIFADATPTDNSDYCYYIATNWHVKHAMDDLASQYTDVVYKYSDYKESEGISIDKFEEYGANNFKYEDTNNFLFGSGNEAIDLAVAKVTFGNPSASVKTKLDNLNNFKTEKGYITKFADVASDETHPVPAQMAWAGFPKLTHTVSEQTYEAPTWKSVEFNPYDSKYNLRYHAKNNLTHSNGSPNVVDVAPQFRIETQQKEIPVMPGGSSGSMLVGRMDGEILTYGIYWGYYNDKEPHTWEQPCFDIFNSDKKQFLDPFIKQE